MILMAGDIHLIWLSFSDSMSGAFFNLFGSHILVKLATNLEYKISLFEFFVF